MTSNLNSLTSITYVAMALWPLSALIHKMFLEEEEEGQISSIDLRGFAAGKKSMEATVVQLLPTCMSVTARGW